MIFNDFIIFLMIFIFSIIVLWLSCGFPCCSYVFLMLYIDSYIEANELRPTNMIMMYDDDDDDDGDDDDDDDVGILIYTFS